MDNVAANSLWQAVQTVVRRRQTTKVMAPPDHPALDESLRAQGDTSVHHSIEIAGWAPFHFDRHVDGIAEPWRVYFLSQPICRTIARSFDEWFTDIKPGNKMPALLTACGCLVLVYWIPQTPAEIDDPIKLERNNEEHLAATAAYVENLLLLLEAAGLSTYWSSGGLLRTSAAHRRLGIPEHQRLLACIFVDYERDAAHRAVEVGAGGQRTRRSPASAWSRDVRLD
jgi:hypothetical protein